VLPSCHIYIHLQSQGVFLEVKLTTVNTVWWWHPSFWLILLDVAAVTVACLWWSMQTSTVVAAPYVSHRQVFKHARRLTASGIPPCVSESFCSREWPLLWGHQDQIQSCPAPRNISIIELVQFWNVFVLPFMSCTWYYITIPFKQTQSIFVWVCGLLMPGTYGVLSKAHSLWDSYVEGFLMMLKPGWRYSPQSKFTGYKIDFQCR